MQLNLFGASVADEKIIKTTSYDNDEIIKDIMFLYCKNGFELDPTYSTGNFYNNIPKPKYRYDLNPQLRDVIKADCRKLPHENESINSIMFDPPFVCGIPVDCPAGIIKQRFGFYKNVPELLNMYYDAMKEFYRILKPGAVLVFKCQDTVDSGKQYLTHVQIINYAAEIGFYPKDLFVLIAENRIIGINSHKQQHARKFHCYFLVFIKQKSLVEYGVKDAHEIIASV